MPKGRLFAYISENAGGPACLKYGVTKHYVIGLEVVLPSGETIELGRKALYQRNFPGYDLMHLIISSEGTLGVVTKSELKVVRLPAARNTIVATYDDVAVAAGAVSRILENGLIPCKIEYIDDWVINRFEDMMQVGLPRDADAVLLIEVVGSQEDTRRDTMKIVEITKHYDARDVRPARDAGEANRFWEARRAGFTAVYGAAKTVLAEDVTVPRGKIPDLANRCKELTKKYAVEIVVLGHAGDGNLHPAILTDINDKEHYERANKALDEIFATTLELGGVISGEHGIGLEKAKFFSQTVDPVAINMMKAVKKLFDPKDIMNPGKIWV
jgi:glycolate oxidase